MYTKYHYLNSISFEVTAIGAAPYLKALSYIIQITQRKQQLLVHTYMVERGQTITWKRCETWRLQQFHDKVSKIDLIKYTEDR